MNYVTTATNKYTIACAIVISVIGRGMTVRAVINK